MSNDFVQELSKVSIEGLRGLSQWAEGAKDVVSAEAPKFAVEYVRYTMISSIFFAVATAIIGLVVAYYLKKTIELMKSGVYGDGAIFGVIVLGVLAFTCLCSFLCCTDTAIKAGFAPRAVIIEKIAEIIRGPR